MIALYYLPPFSSQGEKFPTSARTGRRGNIRSSEMKHLFFELKSEETTNLLVGKRTIAFVRQQQYRMCQRSVIKVAPGCTPSFIENQKPKKKSIA